MFNTSTWVTIGVVVVGSIIAAPTLIKGFVRRGSGVKYEEDFVIQRAPQYASLATIGCTVVGFLEFNHIIDLGPVSPLFALASSDMDPTIRLISWMGVPVLVSGMVFMVGGWMSLGEYFSTDAEVLSEHKVKNTGLLQFVMHPAYSGIIQCLVGSAVAATSPIAAAMAIFVVAPLWLNRAKYEERLLIENLGEPYKEYAEQTKWRRLVPKFIPIGV